jgi:hypothetical protein
MAKAGRKSTPKSQAEGLLAVRTRKSRPNTPAENEKLLKAVLEIVRDRPSMADILHTSLTPRVKLPAHFIPEPQRPLKNAKRSQRRVVEHYQGDRVQIKLAQEFPDGIPSRKELSNSELANRMRKAFDDDPAAKKTGLAIPDRKTILREAGRIPRKK